MGIATDPARELASKIEVLKDLEEPVRELMEAHERKRELWFPSDLLGPQPDDCPGRIHPEACATRQAASRIRSGRRSRSTC